eukprot:CAMPEP_0115306794 /NCGR_PEP_ID=MMETSP0270-20121206/72784_1 /TAXON_ID=71861 /ORGANISM="Scrippsiella trochoidea, Strain CCMP3099" /LENGTH=53 /DNA_ID=CAMNT_0002725167 /DNA_START=247 /DNA_END=408 /DNA_ORIENTATION=-
MSSSMSTTNAKANEFKIKSLNDSVAVSQVSPKMPRNMTIEALGMMTSMTITPR